MTTAYLTIDDGPSTITKELVDILCEHQIVPIMFFQGSNILPNWDNGIYAIKHGAIIGNHGYSHPHFSKLSLEECIEEIEKTEELITMLYMEAGVARTHKLFRFPYGDKGNAYRADFQLEHKTALQQYLSQQGYEQIDPSVISYPWYFENKLDQDIDTYWTFDCEEYLLHQDSSFTYSKIHEHIHNLSPDQGGNFFEEKSHNIILIHDHPQTKAVLDTYFTDIIKECLSMGVNFTTPTFRRLVNDNESINHN